MSRERIRTLLITEAEVFAAAIRSMFASHPECGDEIDWARDLESAVERVRTGPVDVILLMSVPGDRLGVDAFKRLREMAPHVPVVVLSRAADEAAAIEAIHAGAQDYVPAEPLDAGRLHRTLRNAVERQRLRQELVARNEELRKSRVELEARVASRTDDLVRANAELAAAVASLEEYDRAKTEFIVNASHELRTPLTAMIYGMNNMLKGIVGPLSDRQRQYLEMYESESRRLLKTVENILDLRRGDARTIALNKVVLQAERFVRRCVDAWRPAAGTRGVCLAMSVEGACGFLECDPQKMQRALGNVLQNAIRFSPQAGTVDVRLSAGPGTDGQIVLTVTDEGSGIAPDCLRRVTERYFRVGDHVEGAGLGLAVTREILDLHGCNMEFESPPQGRAQGTLVRIRLPGARPPTVLAVDDSRTIRMLLEMELASEGYRVQTCESGAEALEQIRKAPPDMLIVDSIMPGMPGEDLILHVKSDHERRRMPIIMLTGAELDREKRELLEGFRIPALAKPWNRAELLVCIDDAVIGKRYLEG